MIKNCFFLIISSTIQSYQLLFSGIIIIFNMSAQNNADDSMNFSIIDKNQSHQDHLDFSVRSLLENNQTPQKNKQEPPDTITTHQNVFNKIKQIQHNTSKSIIRQIHHQSEECSQQFLKDLSRMEKELSFEAESYNIYEENPNNSIEVIQNNKSKTLSYLKVTKEFTNKSISKENLQDFNDYYGDLIIDFHKKEGKNKEKIVSITDSKNASNNLSSSRSNFNKSKNKKDSKASQELKNFYRLKDIKSPSKNKQLVQPKKSKSKSLSHKIGLSNSKSHSHLKTSTEAETFEEKVFTQYYGTDINFNPQKKNVKKNNHGLSGISSKEKSKSKLTLLSPRTKQSQKCLTKK